MLILLLSGGVTLADTPPSVDAGDGPRLETTLVQFQLDATVTDDGPFTLEWTQQSGPGTITFVDDTVEDALATADTAGVYVLRLTADDGTYVVYDEITIIVSDPSVGGNDEKNFFWR